MSGVPENNNQMVIRFQGGGEGRSLDVSVKSFQELQSKVWGKRWPARPFLINFPLFFLFFFIDFFIFLSKSSLGPLLVIFGFLYKLIYTCMSFNPSTTWLINTHIYPTGCTPHVVSKQHLSSGICSILRIKEGT